MKTIIVTDPCYLISDNDWDKLIKESEEEKGKDWITVFDNAIARFLISISGDRHSVAGSTGFGDWTNEIDGVEFGADSGMVCVVENTSSLQKYLEENNISILPGLAAILPVDENVTYKIDTSNPRWSVVRIKSGNELIESLPAE